MVDKGVAYLKCFLGGILYFGVKLWVNEFGHLIFGFNLSVNLFVGWDHYWEYQFYPGWGEELPQWSGSFFKVYFTQERRSISC